MCVIDQIPFKEKSLQTVLWSLDGIWSSGNEALWLMLWTDFWNAGYQQVTISLVVITPSYTGVGFTIMQMSLMH